MDYFKRTDFPLFPQRYFQLLCLWFRRLYFFCVVWPSWHNPEGIQISSWDQTGALVGWMCKLQHYINGKIRSTLQISFYFHFTFGLGCVTLWKMSGGIFLGLACSLMRPFTPNAKWICGSYCFFFFLHLAKELVTQIVHSYWIYTDTVPGQLTLKSFLSLLIFYIFYIFFFFFFSKDEFFTKCIVL